MTTHENQILDSKKDPQSDPSYEDYEAYIEANSGFLKFGLDRDGFEKAIQAQDSIIEEQNDGKKIVLAVNNDDFELIKTPEHVFLAVAPNVDPVTFEDGTKIVSQRQIKVPTDVADRILKGSYTKIEEVLADITLPEGEELFGDGYAEFIILTKYDTSECPNLEEEPPRQLVTKDGHIVTTDKDIINKHVQGLIELHEAVFEKQAAQIGYYGGMDAEAIESILADDSFIPVVVLDKDTGEPITFALFSQKINDYDKLSWANPAAIEAEIDKQGRAENIAVPLVITAKIAGIGAFREIARMAAMGGVYDTKARTMQVLYESNSWSVLVTPRTIDANSQKVGYKPITNTIEVTVLTQQKIESVKS